MQKDRVQMICKAAVAMALLAPIVALSGPPHGGSMGTGAAKQAGGSMGTGAAKQGSMGTGAAKQGSMGTGAAKQGSMGTGDAKHTGSMGTG